MLKEFKQFILRGSLLDLAVGVVIGVVFAGVIGSLVEDLITPLLAAIGGQPNFAALKFELNNAEFRYGEFLNALFTFLLTAAVLFFFVVKPVNRLTSLAQHREPPDPATRKCPECLSDIPVRARRCAHCTAEVGTEPAPVEPEPSTDRRR